MAKAMRKAIFLAYIYSSSLGQVSSSLVHHNFNHLINKCSTLSESINNRYSDKVSRKAADKISQQILSRSSLEYDSRKRMRREVNDTSTYGTDLPVDCSIEISPYDDNYVLPKFAVIQPRRVRKLIQIL